MSVPLLKNSEDYFDFPENILEFETLPPNKDFDTNPILWEIYSNVHLRNSNQIIIVNGLPRTGKSETCLDLSYVLDRDPIDGGYRFSLDNMKYTLKDYMRLISENNTIGQSLVWEEAGLAEYGANSRDFFREENKDASTIFQSMGFKRHLNFINLPLKGMLDKQLRSLVHWQIYTEKIDSNNFCIARLYKQKIIPGREEIYNNKYAYVTRYGSVNTVFKIKIPRAPLELRREYKNISDAFKTDIQGLLQSKGDDWKNKFYLNEDNEINKKKLYAFLTENMESYISASTKKVDVDSFIVKEDLPDSFKKKITPIIKVFNNELINGQIKYTSGAEELIAKYKEKNKTKGEKAINENIETKKRINQTVEEFKKSKEDRINEEVSKLKQDILDKFKFPKVIGGD